MKVKCITTEQYLDLAALGLPIWSSVGSWDWEQHEEGLIKFLSHPPAQERERERVLSEQRLLLWNFLYSC